MAPSALERGSQLRICIASMVTVLVEDALNVLAAASAFISFLPFVSTII